MPGQVQGKMRKRRQEIHSELKIYNYGAGGDKENGQGALSEENFLKLMKDSKINESHRCKKKTPLHPVMDKHTCTTARLTMIKLPTTKGKDEDGEISRRDK